MNVFEKIDAQCKEREYTPIWGVGQQLKGILRADPSMEDIVDKDLDAKGMSLADCEKKIKARADEIQKAQKIKNVCIPPQEAEKIIREFYGLPETGAPTPEPAEPAAEDTGDALDLSDFF